MEGERLSRLEAYLPMLAISSGALLVVTWGMHVILTALGDPWGVGVDRTLWALSSLAKALTLMAGGAVLATHYRAMHQDRRRCLRFAWTNGLGAIGWLALLAMTRPYWAPFLSGLTVYYFHASASPDQIPLTIPHIAELRQVWLDVYWPWLVVPTEALVFLLVILAHAAVGFRFGRRRMLFLTIPGTLVLLGVVTAIVPWVSHDFDEFVGDVVMTTAIMDWMLLPVAMDPTTTLMAPAYLCFGVINVYLLKTMPPSARVRED